MFKEILSDVWPILEKSAPFISSLVGAPYASVPAVLAMQTLASKFGLSVDEVHKLPSIMQNDPACNDKLCEIESFFSHWLQGTNGSFQMPITDAEINIKLKFKG